MTAFTASELDEITDILKALAHDVRLKLMRTLLDHGEKSVGELEAMTGVGQPGLSQQLAILRKAELVQTRRDAKLVFYSLAPDRLEGTARLLCALAGVARPGMPAGEAPPAAGGPQSRARGSAATFARIL